MHVHYHACDGSWRTASAGYMLGNGLASYAEGEGFVLLYPQAAQGGDLQGCWDWYGATGESTFDTRAGIQLAMVVKMLELVGVESPGRSAVSQRGNLN